jgi:hypothetical protein
MYVSQETPEQTDARLRQVLKAATIRHLPGLWWFGEFSLLDFPGAVRSDALALVRDEEGWSQLVPLVAQDAPTERLRVWSFHFTPGLDNSGFVGWLASHIKRATGSGVLVICGQNSARGGIFDYWACTEEVAPRALEVISALM